jgi:hypothetical protein
MQMSPTSYNSLALSLIFSARILVKSQHYHHLDLGNQMALSLMIIKQPPEIVVLE